MSRPLPPPPPSPAPPPPPSARAGGAVLLRSLLALWSLALGLSALLVAAGRRWPAPPAIDGRLVWALVLGPPLLIALRLAAGWRRPADAGAADRGESGDRA